MRSAVALLLLATACGLPHPSDPYRVTVDVGPWMHDIAIHDDIPNSLWARAALVHIMGRGGEPAQIVQANIERTAVPAVATGSLDERARAALLASDIGNAAGAKVLNEAAIKASNPQ